MPKKKRGKGGGSRSKGARGKGRDRAAARRERRLGQYLSPGDEDYKQLSQQLRKEGLALKDVPGDGNCLFRAFADQLPHRYDNMRRTVVEHMRANEEDYAPFVEDEVSFQEYMADLAKDGSYAGNDVIVAVSRCYGIDVVIHQLAMPNWEVRSPLVPHTQPRRLVHLVYLRGEHYCSVRPLKTGQSSSSQASLDLSSPSASTPSTLLSARLPPASSQPKPEKGVADCGIGLRLGETSCCEPLDPVEAAKMELMESTGCQDESLARQVLMDVGGAMELAVVELLQLMSLTDYTYQLSECDASYLDESAAAGGGGGGVQQMAGCDDAAARASRDALQGAGVQTMSEQCLMVDSSAHKHSQKSCKDVASSK